MAQTPLPKTAFREALIRHREEAGVTLEAIEAGSGVPLSIIGKLCRREGKQTSAENALQIARFFGKTLEEFVGMAEVSQDTQIQRILTRLKPAEKDVVLAQLQGLASR